MLMNTHDRLGFAVESEEFFARLSMDSATQRNELFLPVFIGSWTKSSLEKLL